MATLLVGAAPAPYLPDGNTERAKVPEPFKWKLDALFKDDAAFDAALPRATAELTKLAGCKGTLGDPAKLRGCLEGYFKLRLAVNKLTLYANLRVDSAQKDDALQARNDQAQRALHAFMAGTSFIRQEVLSLDDAAMKAVYAKEPGLAPYRPYLDELRRRRAHVLSPDAERTLSLAGDNLWAEIDLNEIPSDFEKTFRSTLADLPLPKITDEQGKQVQLTLANYPKYRSSTDRRVRQEAVEKLFATFKQYQHVFAGTLGGQVNFTIFLARARGYDTALAAYLDKDNVAPAVYTNLIKAVNQNLAPLHRYVALRKKLLKLPEVRIFDLYPPMVGEVKMEVPYPTALSLVKSALQPLGADYQAVLVKGLEPGSGWVDAYPHKDKESGAFAGSVYGVHPFVKLNYLDDYDGLTTLAHEFGHAVHSDLAMTHQPYLTSSYVPFIAEIASTFNEKLLSDYLVKNAKSDDEKLAILNQLVDSIRGTIYRQALFAEFELSIHTFAEKGTPLTAELLNKTYGELVKRYYGKDFVFGANDDVEWAYIPHLYYKYYVYAYATGLSSGIALAERVQSGKPEARDAYLGMLKGGASKPPLELLKGAGVDLTRPEAVEAAARLMDRTLAEMEKLVAAKK
ncbi:MAG: oligoendopeptidase F [Myxococcaceae bacterium]